MKTAYIPKKSDLIKVNYIKFENKIIKSNKVMSYGRLCEIHKFLANRYNLKINQIMGQFEQI